MQPIAQPQILPVHATHPGGLLKEELEIRKISITSFAVSSGINDFILNQILDMRQAITPDIAIELERVLGVSAGFWLRLQLRFEINSAKINMQQKLNELNISEAKKSEILKEILSA